MNNERHTINNPTQINIGATKNSVETINDFIKHKADNPNELKQDIVNIVDIAQSSIWRSIWLSIKIAILPVTFLAWFITTGFGIYFGNDILYSSTILYRVLVIVVPAILSKWHTFVPLLILGGGLVIALYMIAYIATMGFPKSMRKQARRAFFSSMLLYSAYDLSKKKGK